MSFEKVYAVLRNCVAISVVALAVIGFLAVSTARAQQVAVAEIDGYVTDPSGQAIVGAQVKVTDLDRGTVRTNATDATGRYTFPNLSIGNYQLEVSSPGFKGFVQKGIQLEVASNPQINVHMEIGAVTESVQVNANAAQVETKENSIAQVVDEQRLIDLPLNGRNPASLLQITGFSTSSMNINGNDLTGSKNIQGSNGSGTYSVAGSAANGVNFLLDGGDNNDAFSNVNLPIPFPDAVQEFNLQANGLPAQYGLHPGGVVNIVTKSGANSFHGNLFDFLRNGNLNGRPKGTIISQPARDSLKRNQFGGTGGGRIIKDKLFFFGGYQGTRQRSDPSTSTAYDPTAATLKGDFSVVDAAKSTGGCLSAAKQLKDPNGNPYPGNQIPVSTFDPAGFKFASTYFPVSGDPCGTYRYGVPTNNPDDQWIGRIDYNMSSKNVFFGRYYLYDYLQLPIFNNNNALTTQTAGNWDRSQTMTIGDTYTVSATSVNSFHATFDRRRDNRAGPLNLPSPKDLGVNMFLNTPNFTYASVSGYSGGGFGIGCGSCALANFDINTYQLADDYSIIRGKHQIGFGFDGRKDQFNSYNNQQSNGMFIFNGQTTGDGLADLLIGRFSSLTDGNVISDYLTPDGDGGLRAGCLPRHTALQHQHWRALGALRAGLRQVRARQPVQLAPVYAGLAQPGLSRHSGRPGLLDGFGARSLRQSVHGIPLGDFLAPARPGLGPQRRWQADHSRVVQLQSRYHHAVLSRALDHQCAVCFFDPAYQRPVLQPVLGLRQPPNGKTGDPFPGTAVFPAQGAYVTIPGNLPVTGVMMWNLSYQRQIATNWVIKANYMGNAGRHILGAVDINQAVGSALGPGGAAASTGNTNQRRPTYLDNATTGQYYANIQQTDPGANSEYHGLLLSIERHFLRPLHHLEQLRLESLQQLVGYGGRTGGHSVSEFAQPANRRTGTLRLRPPAGFQHHAGSHQPWRR